MTSYQSALTRVHRPGAKLAVIGVFTLLFAMSLRCGTVAHAAQVPVRYPEGTVHGFLIVKNMNDSALAYGDLLQTVSAGAVNIRMIFNFRDGSRYEESVRFTQSKVFTMQSYSLVMRGPSFATAQTVSLKRVNASKGAYRVEATESDGEKEVHEGEIELPPDTYNGMIVTIAKNLTRQPSTRVHLVAFMPKPRLVELEMLAANQQHFRIGASRRNSVHFVIKPRLGRFTTFFAKLLGKMPGDNHMWIATDDIPAFVRSDGALFTMGPSWRVELAAPVWR